MRQGRERAHLSAQPVRDSTRRLFRRTASAIVRSAFPPQTSVRPDVALTGREQDVVDALCCGRSNKQIAAQLRLSEFTVENHLRRIYRKHAVRNRTSLMAVLGSRSPQAAPS
jgi:DNA-binding NarL/FixJ family response regulator